MAKRRSSTGAGDAVSHDHVEASRLNNPQAGQAEAHLGHPGEAETRVWEHDDRTDPFLSWHGKRENQISEVDVRDLCVYERIKPLSVLDAIRAERARGGGATTAI